MISNAAGLFAKTGFMLVLPLSGFGGRGIQICARVGTAPKRKAATRKVLNRNPTFVRNGLLVFMGAFVSMVKSIKKLSIPRRCAGKLVYFILIFHLHASFAFS
jgi:hypothetical protein